MAATICLGAVTPSLAGLAFGLGFLAVLLALGRFLLPGPCRWKHSPVHLPVAAFLLYTLVRYFTAAVEYEARFELLQVFLCGLIYFVASQNCHRPRDRILFIAVITGLGVLESLYGFWQYARQHDMVLTFERPEYHGRGSGTFFCPNHLAGFLEMVLGLLLARTAFFRDRSASTETMALKKILSVFVMLLVLVGILTTFSRGGWIITFGGLLLFLLWGERRRRFSWPRVVLGLTLMLALLVIGLRYLPLRLSIDRTVRRDPTTEAVRVDTSLGDRTPLWRASLRIIRDYPLWGTGPGTWRWFQGYYREPSMQQNPEYAHSDLLNLAADYGLVGLGLVLAALVYFYRHALQVGRPEQASDERSFAVGSVLAVTMILGHSVLEFNLHIPANAMVLAAIMGFTVAMRDPDDQFPRTEMKLLPRTVVAGAMAILLGAGLYLFVPMSRAYHWWWTGTEAKKGLDWDAALSCYERAMKLDPRFPAPWANAAEILATRARFQPPAQKAKRAENLQEALRLYQRSLELNPRQTLVLLRLAEVYELTEQGDRALQTYNQALAIDPKSAIVYLRLGMFHRNQGNDQQAAEAFLQANRLYSDLIAEEYLANKGLPVK